MALFAALKHETNSYLAHKDGHHIQSTCTGQVPACRNIYSLRHSSLLNRWRTTKQQDYKIKHYFIW